MNRIHLKIIILVLFTLLLMCILIEDRFKVDVYMNDGKQVQEFKLDVEN